MKRLFLASTSAALTLCTCWPAIAANGTISFRGTVVSTTCSTHGGDANGAADFTVILRDVQTTSFTRNATAGRTPYSITVGSSSETACTDGTVVSIYHEPASPLIDALTGNLNNTGDATGVQLQILNSDGTVIDLAHAPTSNPQTIAGHTATLPFFVQYVSIDPSGANVTAGKVASAVLYSVKYN